MIFQGISEAKQREDEDVRMERGYAALQRVQQRALQARCTRCCGCCHEKQNNLEMLIMIYYDHSGLGLV